MNKMLELANDFIELVRGDKKFADELTLRLGYNFATVGNPTAWMVERDSECDPPEFFTTEEQANKNACLGVVATHITPLYRAALPGSLPTQPKMTPRQYREYRGFDDNHWGDDHVQEYLNHLSGSLPIPAPPPEDVPDLYRLAYIPGVWSCPKCNFVLTKTSMNARSGQMGTTEEDRQSEECPNDGTWMVPLTYKEQCKQLADRLEKELTPGPSLPSEETRQILTQLKEIECASYPEARKLNALIEKLCAASPAEGPTAFYRQASPMESREADELASGPKPGPCCPKCGSPEMEASPFGENIQINCNMCYASRSFEQPVPLADLAAFFTPSAGEPQA